MNDFLFDVIATELEDAVGRENCSTRTIDKITHSVDYFWLSRMWADRGLRMPEGDFIVAPKDAKETSAVLKIANYYKLPVTTWGGGGGTQGGAIPVCGGIVLDTKRMNAITDFNEQGMYIECGTGTIYKHLEWAANERGYATMHYPSSLTCSTVGGFLAHRGIDNDRDASGSPFFAFFKSADPFQGRLDLLRRDSRGDIFLYLIIQTVFKDTFDDRLAVLNGPGDLILPTVHTLERVFRNKQQKRSAVPDMRFQCFVVGIADRETLVIPYLPAGLIQFLDDPQHRIPVLVGIADKDERGFFVRQERGREFLDPRRDHAAENIVLVIEDEPEMVFLTIAVHE